MLHGKQGAGARLGRVLACVAEGLGSRATARVFEVAPNPGLQWLLEAAEQLTALAAYFLCEVHVEPLPRDAMDAVWREVTAGARSADEALQRLERSPSWVWTALEPERPLLVVIDVGTRLLEIPQRVVQQVRPALARGCVPLFLTAGFQEYMPALLTHLTLDEQTCKIPGWVANSPS